VKATVATRAKRGIADRGEIQIKAGSVLLAGELSVPENATSVVLFAHGSGSSRHSRRNQYVARVIRDSGIGTLLFDLRWDVVFEVPAT
jgi:hypothetical protein